VWIGAGHGTRNHKRTPSLRSLRSAHPPPRRKRHVPLRIIRRRLWRSELNSVGCAGGGVLQPRRRSPVPRVKVPPVERSFEKSRRLTGNRTETAASKSARTSRDMRRAYLRARSSTGTVWPLLALTAWTVRRAGSVATIERFIHRQLAGRLHSDRRHEAQARDGLTWCSPGSGQRGRRGAGCGSCGLQ